MIFRVGQKVVCINAHYSSSWDDANVMHRPAHGEIYTVRGFGEFRYLNGLFPAVWLVEIKNPIQRWSIEHNLDEIGFPASRFRPVVGRQTDISFAHQILRSVSQTERA